MIADKYKVREYVKERIGEQHIIPLLGMYNKVSVADLKKLPNQFVIKTNRGSGPDHIEIVKNKSGTDLEKLVKKMNRSVKLKFGKLTGEDFYDLIEPKIIAEELLLNDGNVPEVAVVIVFVADKVAWDQSGTPPYLNELVHALDKSLDAAALSYVDYLWRRRGELRVIHPWLVDARVWLVARLAEA